MLKVFVMAKKKRERRKFTKQYKAEVVQLIRESGKALTAVCHELDLTPSAVSEWVKRAAADAGQGPAGVLTTVEREELHRLRREVRELKREKEFLGKAAAFFASQKQLGTRS